MIIFFWCIIILVITKNSSSLSLDDFVGILYSRAAFFKKGFDDNNIITMQIAPEIDIVCVLNLKRTDEQLEKLYYFVDFFSSSLIKCSKLRE